MHDTRSFNDMYNTYAIDFPLKGNGGETADQTQNTIWIWKGEIISSEWNIKKICLEE
jgi:hypothetical protein